MLNMINKLPSTLFFLIFIQFSQFFHEDNNIEECKLFYLKNTTVEDVQGQIH